MDLVLWGVGVATKAIPDPQAGDKPMQRSTSESPPPPVFAKRRRRGLVSAVLVFAVLAAAWAGVWFWAAGWADQQAARTLQELAQRGVEVDCRDRGVSGFPFALRITCGETAVAERSTETKASLAGVSGGASLFSPMTARVGMTSPARIEAPGAGTAAMTWRNAALGVGLGMNGPRDVTFDTAGIEANLSLAEVPVEKVAAVSAEGSLSPSANGGTEVALAFTDLGVTFAGGALPKVSGTAAGELSVPPRALLAGRAAMQAPVWARGIEIALQSGGAKINVGGEISVDGDGVIDGQITLRVGGADKLPAVIAQLPPAWQKHGNAVAGGLFAFGKAATLDGEPASELIVEINRGTARIGPIEFGLPRVPI